MGNLLDKAKALKIPEPETIQMPLTVEKVEKRPVEPLEAIEILKTQQNLVKQTVKQNKEIVKQTSKLMDKVLEKQNDEIKEIMKPKKLMVSTPDPAKTLSKGKKTKKGRVFAFTGKHGTGKTYACCNLAEAFKKSLYLDTEYKASEIFDEQYPDLRYDMKEPIKDDNKKLSQIFKAGSDVHIDVCQVIDKRTGQRDDIATVQYIVKNTPTYLKLIASGKYKNFIIDSCSPIWDYALKVWLKKNKRIRPNKFEFSEIEAIKQETLLPFVNYCKIYGVNFILTFGITGHYVNDVMIGYKEDAKQWLLGLFSYELWFEYDYMKYCIKHPYRPFWSIQDEGLDISEYLFDKEFIDNKVKFKEFEEFKYESMTSESYREETKKRGLNISKS